MSDPRTSNRLGLSTVFLLHGLINGLWFAHIPWLQERLAISKVDLSFAILAGTLGSLPGLLLAGRLAERIGTRRLITITGIGFCIMLPVIMASPSLVFLAIALGINGLFLGAMDVSINARASEVEIAYGRSIMSSFHAFWSFAGLGAAGIAKLIQLAGFDVRLFMVGATLVFLAATLWAISRMVNLSPAPASVAAPAAAPAARRLVILPVGALIPVALLVLMAFVSEGAVYDWGALFLKQDRGLDNGTAALGYGGFSLLMAIGRFLGDALVRRIGQSRTIIWSSALAALCMAAAVIVPIPMVSLACLALTGLGMANIVPILFSVAGKSKAMPAGQGIAAVSMTGYAGFLAGPPLMGFVAESAGLSFSMGIILSFSLIIALSAGFLLRPALASARDALAAKADA